METIELKKIDPEITEKDQLYFQRITSSVLTPEQKKIITHPEASYPEEKTILAVHWHPEFVPMELIKKRIDAFFPNRTKELIIPTQHNQIMSYEGFCGVEVDCYAPEFNLKVQFLIHFHESKLEKIGVFHKMLAHTFNYRSSQLFEFMDTIVDKKYEDRIQRAATLSGSDEDVIEFCRIYTRKLKKMIEHNRSNLQPDMIKNKLVRNYFDQLREEYDGVLLDHIQVFLKEVKEIVKKNFNLKYFFKVNEVIEEIRSFGAGIIIPHPEQFWPILLADYDVDGYEVWNPQSRQYTEFLIDVVDRKNKTSNRDRKLLVFAGDDCHMSEKIKEEPARDMEKSGRELGVQPVWSDLIIHNRLVKSAFDKETIIDEYRSRLMT